MGKSVKINPFNRVEGDLEITVEIEDGKVADARASGVMFRGFEIILKERNPMDAIVFTPRICGICGGAHSTAASNALRSASGSKMPPNGYLVRNIAFACENVMSHPTHFYALFVIDFTNRKYSAYPAYNELVRRFAPMRGTSYLGAIKERKRFLEILGLLIGKWPNTLAYHPGGITKALNMSEITRALGILSEFQNFVEEKVLGGSVERWLENKGLDDLEKWLGEGCHAESDLGLFINACRDSGLDKIGRGPGRFLSYGAYDQPDGTTWLPGGYFDGALHPFDEKRISEHIKHSWFEGYEGGRHPLEGMTQPDIDKPGAYSWAKSPRYDNKVVEVGPLARMVIDKDPLVLDMVNVLGPSVYTRALARLHECVRLLEQMKRWLKQINPGEPFYIKPEIPQNACGSGLTEAARGALGHWIKIENGKIKNYQVITPTAWNISPRDSGDNPGAIEQALLGTPVEDKDNPVEVYHVVRSYDPCLVCTVHAYGGNKHLKTAGLGHVHD
ncbi:MAG: nickel-dependent hydrogenase large subunit [Chloroflexi bacterium]|nr:nickel-dependent hydrogenase large subunit [Chloroflexota bacterium]